jgi:predicted type IV restriction endonuclease
VDLVEKFKRNHKEYKLSNYSEIHTRQEFINPFFEALGWDMYNDQGLSEADKEVLHAPSLIVGSTIFAPDYAFRAMGNLKFLVEAKKPSINLVKNTNPVHQLRSYAWNAKIPISIITNFKELAIYDCRYPPKKTDDVNTALISYLKCKDYVLCWDWVSSKFSKTDIQQGCLDKFLKEDENKKGTKEVDAASFVEEISIWRAELISLQAQNRIKIRRERLKTAK